MVISKLDLKVIDYMSPNPTSVDPSVQLIDAISIMHKKKIGNLIVNDKKGLPFGILTEREIIEYLVKDGGIPDTEMRNAKTRPFSVISSDRTIMDAAEILIEKKKRLLVFDDDKLSGIITASDMLRGLVNTGNNLALDTFASKKVHACEHFDSIFKAVNMMFKKRIGSVLVMKNRQPYGIFTERDLLKILYKDIRMSDKLDKNCSRPLITAKYGIKTLQAARIMTLNNIKRLVLMRRNDIVGIVTARDMVEAYRIG